ncbi:MAG: hypothetical protein RMJ56_08670 [Gemmataceae bacterium]|nr:hypothetical protein [Gemmata sp.]MDW8197659.1 hypothetical protein [Gemmataceae bacterium]
MTRRFWLILIALTLLMPLSGCGCRRNSCCAERSFAPPPTCCDRTLPPGLIPNPNP